MSKKFICLIMLLALTVPLSACAKQVPLQSDSHAKVELSSWLPYWDAASATREYRYMDKRLARLTLFAADYDSEDRLRIPDELRDAMQTIHPKSEVYLSVTNDYHTSTGKSVEKDRELLRRVFASPDTMDRAIEDMIAAAKELNCTGIELDYEAFWKDSDLKRAYLDFTYRLYRRVQIEGLKLRIVLEPSAPMDADFIKGPAYIVMLYNLYGKHSGPGPKADGDFIEKVMKQMDTLPGDKRVAFATGGCIWENYGFFGLFGTRRFITAEEAKSLEMQYKAVPVREAASAVLHFTFEKDGKPCEVWYADAETMNAWITKAANLGAVEVSIWRLGSNIEVKKIQN